MKLLPVCKQSVSERKTFDSVRKFFRVYCDLRSSRGDCIASRVAADSVVFFSSMVRGKIYEH